MSLNANALLQLDEAREELKIGSSLKADSILERRINALSETFELRTQWILAQQDLIAYRVDGSTEGSTTSDFLVGAGYGQQYTSDGYRFWGSRYHIRIPIVPIQSVSKIEMRYQANDLTYQTITDPTQFILKGMDRFGHSLTGHLQLFNFSFLPGKENILLDMRVGFSSDHPTLAQMKRLMIMQLAYEFNRWDKNEVGIISRSLPDGSVSYVPPQNLLREVEDGLNDVHSWSFH